MFFWGVFYHKIVVLSTSLHVWGIVGLCKSKTIQPDVNYNQTTATTALLKISVRFVDHERMMVVSISRSF